MTTHFFSLFFLIYISRELYTKERRLAAVTVRARRGAVLLIWLQMVQMTGDLSFACGLF